MSPKEMLIATIAGQIFAAWEVGQPREGRTARLRDMQWAVKRARSIVRAASSQRRPSKTVMKIA